MLTRLEVSGFKTFGDFSLDFGPFLVIFGPNGAGKSNLFDAIRLMSRLAEVDLRTAVTGLRGKPHEIFRISSDGTATDTFKLAAEVLLDRTIRDPWGASVNLKYTRLRYEVEIARRTDTRGIERLVVAREEARPILASEDPWRTSKRVSADFRRSALFYDRRTPFLSTEVVNGQPTFAIGQDGHCARNSGLGAFFSWIQWLCGARARRLRPRKWSRTAPTWRQYLRAYKRRPRPMPDHREQLPTSRPTWVR